MGSEWRKTTWGDLISLEYGKALRDYKGDKGKYRVFGSNGPVGWTDKPLVEGPGVILGRKGAYRGIEYSPDPFFVIDTAYFVKPKTEIDLRWLYYAMIHHRIGEINDGSPIPSTTRAAVYVRELMFPDLPEQQVIAHILGSLDDKIELNRKMNETLEGMAQALFKSWFVDFDPVIDNALAAGNPIPDELAERAAMREALGDLSACLPEHNSQSGGHAQAGKRKPLPEHIRTLFPDSFAHTEEMGWIPKGWEVGCFGDVSKCFDNKRIPLSKNQREQKKPGTIPYYGATSVMDYINEWIFDGIYLLVGEDGSVVREDGSPFVQYIWDKTWVNNHAHVLQGDQGLTTEHLMLFMQSQNVRAYVTGAVQLKINQKNMNSIPFLIASYDINRAFADWIDPLFEQKRKLTDSGHNLSKLRDVLLPRLLSGELVVSDVTHLEVEGFA